LSQYEPVAITDDGYLKICICGKRFCLDTRKIGKPRDLEVETCRDCSEKKLKLKKDYSYVWS